MIAPTAWGAAKPRLRSNPSNLSGCWGALLGVKWVDLECGTMVDMERACRLAVDVWAIAVVSIVNYAVDWRLGRVHVTHALAGLTVAPLCWFDFLFVEHAHISVFC